MVSHFRSLIFLWFCSHLVELVSKLSHGSWWLASKAQRLHSRLQHLSQMTSHCQVLDQGTVRAVFAPVRRWCVIHNNCCCETVSHVHVVCNELFPLVLIEKASTMRELATVLPLALFSSKGWAITDHISQRAPFLMLSALNSASDRNTPLRTRKPS